MNEEKEYEESNEYEKYKKDIQFIDRDLYYVCFSWKVKEFLKPYGFYYEYKDKHIKTGKVFYVYEKSNKLDMALKEYSRLKMEWIRKKKWDENNIGLIDD